MSTIEHFLVTFFLGGGGRGILVETMKHYGGAFYRRNKRIMN